ncbi:amino acid permease/ SLC12A domain-containing protein [Radiomyces spectabilis]|uniref:amino acid permease/ SLC12A domain-containing protein n=1 Tax=Radiomyces spectabilis TaxID=64574 RepID=UPI00221EB68B|nr:amino acid permease/ SLC12A domain-containing protein [Radiomyces spectabilis]KAI8376560.1 amino acid permease/ SLC12A domain-containing protein [Radiomyces spectabilis]
MIPITSSDTKPIVVESATQSVKVLEDIKFAEYASTESNHDTVRDPESGLKRTLKSRHLAMISIGGVIGQGLFLSSGANLAKAGPAGLLIAYAVVGFIVFWVAFQLGEIAAYIPISGSFTVYCRRFVDKSFGTVIGYNYWACWSIIVAVELVAIPLVMRFWTDRVPDWAWSAIFLVIMFCMNLYGARCWGEIEYWFSMVKILAVIVFVIVGCCTSGGLVGDQVYGFKYWNDPGAFSNGALGVINALVLAALTMTGTDIVGVSAGESSNPRKAIPAAVKNVFYRIICIYVFSVFVMGMIIPWNDPHNLRAGNRDVSVSPFTLVFQKAGLSGASHVVNAVVLVTLISCGNSGMYVTTRTLCALANEGIAHHKLAYVNKRGVPIYALLCTSAVSLVCFLTSFIPGEALFLVLADLAGIAGMITWTGIAISHYRFRKAFIAQGKDLNSLPYVAPGHPYMNILVIVACVVIILMSGWSYFVPASATGLVGSYGGVILVVVGFIVLKFWTKSRLVPLAEIDLDTDVRQYSAEELEIEKEENASRGIWQKLKLIFT